MNILKEDESIKWLILATLMATMSPLLLKQYSITKEQKYLVITFFVFMLSFYAQVNLFNIKKLGSTYSMLSVLTILLVVLTSYFYFQEKLSESQMIGIVFAIFSVYLLS